MVHIFSSDTFFFSVGGIHLAFHVGAILVTKFLILLCENISVYHSILIDTCWNLVLFILFLFGFYWASCLCKIMSCTHFGSFWPKNNVFALFSLANFSWNQITCILYFWYSPQVPETLFIFPPNIFLGVLQTILFLLSCPQDNWFFPPSSSFFLSKECFIYILYFSEILIKYWFFKYFLQFPDFYTLIVSPLSRWTYRQVIATL